MEILPRSTNNEVDDHIVDIETSSRTDYRLGFALAQGSISLQKYLYHSLRPYYTSSWKQSDLDSVAARYQANHTDMIPKMPRGHAKYLAIKLTSTVPEEFANRWVDFSQYTLQGEKEEVNVKDTCWLISKLMVAKDLKKVTDGRAADNTLHDAHASFFRNYVLLGETTTSPAFDASFTEIRSYTQGSGFMANPDLAKLQSAWSEHHSDEQFFP